MVYMNGTKNARLVTSIVNQNQGGGEKKAGFPGIVGRDSWVSIFYKTNGKNCCKLSKYNTLRLTQPDVQSRPIGVDARIPMR
jgi:hypothetical protein